MLYRKVIKPLSDYWHDMLYEKRAVIIAFAVIIVFAIVLGLIIGTCATSDFFRNFNIW